MVKKAVPQNLHLGEIFEFKITLRRIKPKIWRRFAIPAEYTLGNLHNVIQEVMGWTGYHLHEFIIDDEYYCSQDPDEGYEMEGIEENSMRLNQLFKAVGAKFDYEYDFGDGWEHELKLMKTYSAKPDTVYPICLAGERACPPEDCGGPWGYADLLDAVSDPDHPEHEEKLEWLGDNFNPEEFDIEFINESLQNHAKRPNVIPFPGPSKAKKR